MEANKYFLEYMASFSEDYLNLVKKDFETSSDFSVDDMITFSKPYHEINENIVRSFLAKLRNNEITAPQSLAYSETLDIQQYLAELDLAQLNNSVYELRKKLKEAEKTNRAIGIIFREIPQIPVVELLLGKLLIEYYPEAKIQVGELIKIDKDNHTGVNCCRNNGQPNKKQPRPLCDKCESYSYLLGDQAVIDFRNFKAHIHEDQLLKNRLWTNICKNKKLIKEMDFEILWKIISTMFFIAGTNAAIWKKPPETITEIWTEFPTDLRNDMRDTLKCLRRNTLFAQENYVDFQNRKINLIDELNTSKVVTIYGEGGLGKTELVYQSLDELVEKGNFEFDFFFPFTFKNDDQGEHQISSIDSRDANQMGWRPSSEFTQILDVLSTTPKGHKPTNNKEERRQRAVDFVVNQKVCLIIDNHETIEASEHQELDVFLTAITKHENFSKSNSKIIITTRVRPPNSRRGVKMAIDYLSVREMTELAKRRAIWVARTSSEEYIHFPLDKESNEHWEHLTHFMEAEIGSGLRRSIAGHPLVVFIAVHEVMIENPKKRQLHEVIQDLLIDAERGSGGKLDKLMKYITGRSFGYIEDIDECYEILYHLADLHSFSEEDYNRVAVDYTYQNFNSLIDSLVKLELVGRIQDTYSFRSKYHSEDLKEYLIKNYELEEPKSWISDWWSKKYEILSSRPLIVKDLQYLKIDTEVARAQLEKMGQGSFTPF